MQIRLLFNFILILVSFKQSLFAPFNLGTTSVSQNNLAVQPSLQKSLDLAKQIYAKNPAVSPAAAPAKTAVVPPSASASAQTASTQAAAKTVVTPAVTTPPQLQVTLTTTGTQSILNLGTSSINLNSYSVASSITPGTIPGWGTNPGWNFNLANMAGGNGYAFISDPWGGNSTAVVNLNDYEPSGVVTDQILQVGTNSQPTPFYTAMVNATNGAVSGSLVYQFVLLGVDKNYQYISNIITTTPTYFGLFVFDGKGNLLKDALGNQLIVYFDARMYEGLGSYTLQSGATGTGSFVVGGLGILSTGGGPFDISGNVVPNALMQYPFVLQVYNQTIPALKPIQFSATTQMPTAPVLTGQTPGVATGFSVSSGQNNLVGTDLWVAVTINGTNYLLANNATPGLTATTLLNMPPKLNATQYLIWETGVYFNLIAFNNQVWICAQDSNQNVLAWDVIPGLTSLAQITSLSWSGGYMGGGPVAGTAGTPVLYKINPAAIQGPIAAPVSENQSVTSYTLSQITSALSVKQTSEISVSLVQKSSANQTAVMLTISADTNAPTAENGGTGYYVGMFTGFEGQMDVDISSILSTLTAPYTMMLVGVDNDNKMMPSLSSSTTPFNHFVIYIFDGSGNLVKGCPVTINEPSAITPPPNNIKIFNDNTMIVYIQDSQSNIIKQKTLTYPFTINVTNVAPVQASTTSTANTATFLTLSQLDAAIHFTNMNSPITVSISQAPTLNYTDENNMNYNIALAAGQSNIQVDISGKIKPSYSMALIAVDTSNTIMTSLTTPLKTPFKQFVIYLFDSTGASVGLPISVVESGTGFLANYPLGYESSSVHYQALLYPASGSSGGWVNYPFIATIAA